MRNFNVSFRTQKHHLFKLSSKHDLEKWKKTEKQINQMTTHIYMSTMHILNLNPVKPDMK